MMPAHTVLLVCSGNICRSPMAAALLRQALGATSLWKTLSAGTATLGGIPASAEAVAVLEELDVELRPHRSQPLTPTLIDAADVVVAMTRAHRDAVLRQRAGATDKAFLLRDFDAAASGRDLEDPIGGDLAVYRHCRDQIRACLPGLVAFLRTVAAPGPL